MTKELFVNGTFMHRLGLYPNLTGAEFMGEFRTAPVYRLYSIGDVHPGNVPGSLVAIAAGTILAWLSCVFGWSFGGMNPDTVSGSVANLGLSSA